MAKPHKHAELIKAWADNQELKFQFRKDGSEEWLDIANCDRGFVDPAWYLDYQYRIKPELPRYPQTKMTAAELESEWNEAILDAAYLQEDETARKAIANAAIARAIEDGDVITAQAANDAIHAANQSANDRLDAQYQRGLTDGVHRAIEDGQVVPISEAKPGIRPHNPYTGQLRDPRDIESDPMGVLIRHPAEPLLAATFSVTPEHQNVETIEVVKVSGQEFVPAAMLEKLAKEVWDTVHAQSKPASSNSEVGKAVIAAIIASVREGK